MRELHVVYTDFGEDGWGISSPQIPDLIGGRRTIQIALDDTEGILTWSGWEPGSYVLHRHEQKYVTSAAGDEFYLRFAEDRSSEREAALGRVLYGIEQGDLEDLPRMPTLITGEHLVIGMLADDTMGWMTDQLANDEGAYLAYYAGDDALYQFPAYSSDLEPGRGSSLEALGLTRASTMLEMVDRVMADEVNDLRIAVHHAHGAPA